MGFEPDPLPITEANLREWFAESAETLGYGWAPLLLVSARVAANLLGAEWVRDHILSTGKKSPYLQHSPRDYSNLRSWRNWNVGEMLFNLQHVPGFAEKLPELAKDGVEAMVAELEGAAVARQRNWSSRFVSRTGRKGEDFDMLVSVAGFASVKVV